MDFCIDWARQARTGVAEAVLCEHKSPAQISRIVDHARSERRRLFLTRLTPQKLSEMDPVTRDSLDYDEMSQTAIEGPATELSPAPVGIVCAGTSDMPVAAEAARTLAFHGLEATMITDVGVAGLHRLLDRISEISRFRVVIAVAGMEGALFSVLAGLIPAPVIAVPASVGYGVARDGAAALSSALASCAPGVVTVNIDNGFGAAAAAIKLLLSAQAVAGAPNW